MLVISRKKDERIMIGDGIEVCVCAIRGGKVRIGIQVYRKELWDDNHRKAAIQAGRPNRAAGDAG